MSHDAITPLIIKARGWRVPPSAADRPRRSRMTASHHADPLLTESSSSATESDELAVNKRKLLIGAGLCTCFMLAEIVGGFLAGSLAVMTDAAHMLSDVAGCALARPAIHTANV